MEKLTIGYTDNNEMDLCSQWTIKPPYFGEENMPNIKITAEIDGKQVPLETISTDTFEAIKTLEKPKEIPVARWATRAESPRLIFIPSQDIHFQVGRVYALDLREGDLGANWLLKDDDGWINQYENIKPL